MSTDIQPTPGHVDDAGGSGQAGSGLDYKWIALSNTTLGVFMASIDTSIVMIATPAIFKGIDVDPLAPAETNYFLWLLLGYMMVTASLLVACGRISDLYGRVRLYNLGFAVYTLGSLLLTCTPGSGNTAALQLIIYRLIQGLGLRQHCSRRSWDTIPWARWCRALFCTAFRPTRKPSCSAKVSSRT